MQSCRPFPHIGFWTLMKCYNSTPILNSDNLIKRECVFVNKENTMPLSNEL